MAYDSNLGLRPKGLISRILVQKLLGPLAQSVEQQTFNLWVVGSIPTGPTPHTWILPSNI